MAVVIFGNDPLNEARALLSVLSLWILDQPRPEQAPPAKAHCSYDDDGDLRTVTVTLAEGD